MCWLMTIHKYCGSTYPDNTECQRIWAHDQFVIPCDSPHANLPKTYMGPCWNNRSPVPEPGDTLRRYVKEKNGCESCASIHDQITEGRAAPVQHTDSQQNGGKLRPMPEEEDHDDWEIIDDAHGEEN